jgi:hypothetical protein
MATLQRNFVVTAQTERTGWMRCGGLTKIQAEQLLEWLELNGCRQRQLSLDAKGFVVCYQRSQELAGAPVVNHPSASVRKPLCRLTRRPASTRRGRHWTSSRSTKKWRRLG